MQGSTLTNTLPLMEHFYTLQGEGYHQGKAAYFLRLGGCDVGCVWCDVKESWDASKHPQHLPSELVDAVTKTPAKLVVITGGEPLMHDLGTLTSLLQAQGLATHLETSGAHPLSGQWNWICVSPKKFKAPLDSVLTAAHELKVVFYTPSDLEWAEQHAKRANTTCKLYLQPEWSKKEKITPLLLDYIKQHPQWELSLQVHKYLDIP